MSPHSWRLWDPKTENDDLIQDAVLQAWLSQVPPWRKAVGNHKLPGDDDLFKAALKREEKGETWIVPAADSDDFERIIQRIHMALWLRRPLLVEGAPGIGKSSLAYALAYRFGLGRVLKWEISSRSRKQDGLYSYDSVSHFRQIQENQSGGNPEETSEISNFIRLGPLGSALLGGDKLGDFLKPRVLLVDELDKADYDLPNDLLHVLEDAKFEISELPGNLNSVIETHEGWQTNAVQKQIICNAHPVVVITSNGEREFPAAFLRRCVRLELKTPGDEALNKIIQSHFGHSNYDVEKNPEIKNHSPDKVLQALFLESQGMSLSEAIQSLDSNSG